MIKYELFHKGSSALSRLGLSDRSIYRCPICENDFDQNDIDSGELTLEHIPPQSIGADFCILTCQSCNTTAGTKLDSQVAIRHKNTQFARGLLTKQGQCTAKGAFQLGPDTLNVKFVVENGRLEIHLLSQINDPAKRQSVLDQLHRLTDGGWEGQLFTVTLSPGFDTWRARIGDLRIAYLTLFAVFGYTYAFSDALDDVRAQLRRPGQRILDSYFFSVPRSSTTQRFIGIVKKPFKCIVVCFLGSAVFLPLWIDDCNFYKRAAAILNQQSRRSLSGLIQIQWPEEMQLFFDYYPQKIEEFHQLLSLKSNNS